MKSEQPVEINERSRVPLYIVYSAMVITAACVLTVTKLFYTIDRRLERIERHLAADWMLADQERWANALQRRNPEMDVPEVAVKGYEPNP